MDFDLTDEQQLIQGTAREFTDNEIIVQSRENARNHHFDVEMVKKVAAQGYLGAIVPEEYGARASTTSATASSSRRSVAATRRSAR